MPDENENVEVTLDNIDVTDLFASMDINEAEVMYEISGVVQEDFIAADPTASEAEQHERDRRVEQMLKAPRFKRAALTVLTMRQNPTITRAEAEEAVGKVNMLKVIVAMFGDEGEDPTQDSQQQPESETGSRTPSLSEGSGSPSTTGSEEQENQQATTGAQPSDTSSLRSLATT